MKINGNEIKNGNVIEHRNSLWMVVKVSHVKPGKGGAFAQVEMKNIINTSKLNERFRSSETVEKVRLEQRKFQFLYQNDDDVHFMDIYNFEQITLTTKFIGKDKTRFLSEDMNVDILMYEDKIINIELPEQIVVEVEQTDPTIKGQTVTSSYKPAILHNNVKIMVPPFINSGNKILINPNIPEYIKKAE